MSEENVELVRRAYTMMNETIRTGEFSSIAELWEPDMVLTPSGLLPERGDWVGHDGIRRSVQVQAEAFEELQVEL